jgi:hypothetical protein
MTLPGICHFERSEKSLRCRCERSEASRSLNLIVLLAVNEILRRSAPQNAIGQESVISSAARNPCDVAFAGPIY